VPPPAAQVTLESPPFNPGVPSPDAPTAGQQPSVVITHDFAEIYGGAERVTEEIARAFPDAPVYAVTGRPCVAERMGVGDRFHTILAPRRRLLEGYRLLTPAFPPLVDRVRLPEADVLVSSSYAFAHRLRTRNDAAQLCYCHSPLRFAWSMTDNYRHEYLGKRRVAGAAFDLFATAMRRSDRRTSARVDHYLTQSPFVADQIREFYGRDADVVGAPIACDRFRPGGTPGDYYLICCRLVEPYKRVGLTLEAFRRLDRRLIVAGDGPAYAELRAAAPPNVEFTGHLEDDELIPLMQRCLATVFPSRDDFGLIPLEAMACGRPVIAYAGGGAMHTVVPGLTGEFFAEQTVDALAEAIGSFDPGAYDSAAIRAHAEQWDARRFRARIAAAVRALAPAV
jgi:glycosyltransferase involved in cell wall biosynthesis